jgi:hypothetical protein
MMVKPKVESNLMYFYHHVLSELKSASVSVFDNHCLVNTVLDMRDSMGITAVEALIDKTKNMPRWAISAQIDILDAMPMHAEVQRRQKKKRTVRNG